MIASAVSIVLEEVAYQPEGASHPILHGIRLSIPPGQFVAIMGPNGSGKSTLVKHFNALHLPTSGVVRVGGLETSRADALLPIREKVGMVFQNPDHQMVTTVVEEEVAFGPENLGLPPAEIRERVEEALRATRLEPWRLHNPAHLSGGQKQRVAIASILAMRPEVMVLDEPTAMLDATSQAEVLEALDRLHREAAVTVVLVTHSVAEALRADRIVFLERGIVALDAPPREALAAMLQTRAHALQIPDPVRFLTALRALGLPVADVFARDADEAVRRVLEAVA